MKLIYYATTSAIKFEMAGTHLKNHGIKVVQKKIEIKEIQSDSIREIAVDKAKKIFAIIRRPLLVNDSGWFITALNGFPGAFMAYVNKWFTADDFIALMKGKKNREIILKQIVVYIDNGGFKVFEHDSVGEVLKRASKNVGRPSEMIASFSNDNFSLTDKRISGKIGLALEAEAELWHEIANWLKKNEKA